MQQYFEGELLGRIVFDLSPAKQKGDITYISFRVAVNRTKKEKQEATFVDLVAFGEQAERLAKFNLKKGTLIQISGKLNVVAANMANENSPLVSIKVDKFRIMNTPYAPETKDSLEADIEAETTEAVTA